ncbi:MAG: DUF3299 domain-containing protein [Oligoflexales bacterium]|nr:DUF3299 domain-containing protein [Oligoflexales bacterium]
MEENTKTKDNSVMIGVVSTLITFILLGAVIYFMVSRFGAADSKGSDVVELDWRQMQELDEKSKQVPKWFRELNGKMVKVPGYAVPLEDNLREIREFLLVPDAMSCIHSPPPPPNMTVYVKMSKPIVYNSYQRAVWITGQLSIENTESQVAPAAWKLRGAKMDPYIFKE